MKKRIISILLCFCMALTLLPTSALATAYNSWAAATADGVTLNNGDKVTIGGIDYTYKVNADTTGITMYTSGGSTKALTEACCWKAGGGYVLYKPTVVTFTAQNPYQDYFTGTYTTSAEVTLHDATISTASAFALSLPYTAPSSTAYPVPVTVKLEGTNSLTTTDANYYALSHDAGDTTFTGGGTLSITGSLWHKNAVTIQSGVQVTVSSSAIKQIDGNLTVTGSGSKLAIAGDTTLIIGSTGGSPTATVRVKDGAVLENNGTLCMAERTKNEPGITGAISGGVIEFSGGSLYCLVDGVFIAYGGDVSKSGLNISGKNNDGTENSAYNVPTVTTRYKAGSGYISYTPATADPVAKAKLELHGAVVSTTNATAISLPSDAPVDIVVASDSSITAGGSGNVINTNGQSLSVTGSGDLTLAGPYYGINVNGIGAINIDITGDLTFDTGSRPIDTSGGITVSAKSILSKTGYNIYSGGLVSLTATDGDISLTTKNSFMGAVNCSGSVSLMANKGAVTIAHSDNASGGYALNGTVVMVSALNDVTITTSRGGIDASSGAVSVTSQSGSIQMDCAMDQCVSAEDAVALNAAKDITLNDSSTSSTAISATSRAVNVTTGGTLTSTSAYGFQTGALTIKANEVSVAGTQQDGIYATSVSITNPTGGNCKRVSITATSSSDANRAAIRALGSTTTGNITVKADDLFLSGNGSAKAISTLGTVNIEGAGLIVGAITAGTDKISTGIARASKSGGGISTSGLDLSTPPADTTVYTAGNGYALFTPKSGETPATLTLHNAEISSNGFGTLQFGAETVIKLEGTNSLTNSNTGSNVGIKARSNSNEPQPVTIQGGSGDSLTVSASQCTNVGALTVSGGSVTMNGSVYGMVTEGNLILKDGTQVSATGGDKGCALMLEKFDSESETVDLTVDSGSTLTVNGNAIIAGNLTVTGSGSKLSVNSGARFDVAGTVTVGSGAALENNGIVGMKLGTTVEQIKALKLTGTGAVRVITAYDEDTYVTEWDTYTNDGVKVNEITGGLDLTAGVDHSGKTVASDGYAWDAASSTLTLGNNAYVSGDLTLPCNTAVTINTTASSSIGGGITAASDAGGYHYPLQLTFTGTAPLTISDGISGGVNHDTVTAQGGAQVTINGFVSIGASGTDGTLNVIGAGTALTILSSGGYGALCDTINVQNGAALTVHTEGAGTRGVEALGGGVHITGGSTLETGCDYGVYIAGGKLEVDSSSKLITNGVVAPFCTVGAAGSTVDQVLSLPSTPSGTTIQSVTGTNGKYWSLVPTGGSLTVSNENHTPVTLSGAKTGKLTFVKAASSGGSSGGSISTVSYKLSFETNGGTKLSDVSKENGTTLDLASYKPTRDGYDFDGWYADKALTEKVTSVKLTKNTTIYAKWTEKPTKVVNPFADVSENAYYHDAVLWAVQKNVTSGTTNTAFSPDMICTRAQMVTFLWRAMGSPEPTSANCPFTDVSKDAYYYKAVLWAVEKGITAGASQTTFSPNATVTRGQSVTFMWRAAGKPAVTSANPFTDVSKDAYYYNAMLWAVEKGITQGTSSTTFSPSGSCTRSQIVTFLYRYAGK